MINMDMRRHILTDYKNITTEFQFPYPSVSIRG